MYFVRYNPTVNTTFLTSTVSSTQSNNAKRTKWPNSSWKRHATWTCHCIQQLGANYKFLPLVGKFLWSWSGIIVLQVVIHFQRWVMDEDHNSVWNILQVQSFHPRKEENMSEPGSGWKDPQTWFVKHVGSRYLLQHRFYTIHSWI